MKTTITPKWKYETIGLALLLAAFGFQCIANYTSNRSAEVWRYEITQTINKIWDSEYDKATKDPERYKGKVVVWNEYDHSNQTVSQYGDIKMSQKQYDTINSVCSYIYITLYFLGSILVLVSKINKKKNIHQ